MRAPYDEQALYFIRFQKYVKIGVSINPQARLSGIQVDLPEKLEVIEIIPKAGYLESQCHNQLRHLWARGEWFIYSEEILDMIQSVKRNILMGKPGDVAPPFVAQDILEMIVWYQREHSGTSPSVEYIAKAFGLRIKTVLKTIDRFVEWGFLTCRMFPGKNRILGFDVRNVGLTYINANVN